MFIVRSGFRSKHGNLNKYRRKDRTVFISFLPQFVTPRQYFDGNGCIICRTKATATFTYRIGCCKQQYTQMYTNSIVFKDSNQKYLLCAPREMSFLSKFHEVIIVKLTCENRIEIDVISCMKCCNFNNRSWRQIKFYAGNIAWRSVVNINIKREFRSNACHK